MVGRTRSRSSAHWLPRLGVSAPLDRPPGSFRPGSSPRTLCLEPLVAQGPFARERAEAESNSWYRNPRRGFATGLRFAAIGPLIFASLARINLLRPRFKFGYKGKIGIQEAGRGGNQIFKKALSFAAISQLWRAARPDQEQPGRSRCGRRPPLHEPKDVAVLCARCGFPSTAFTFRPTFLCKH